MQYQQSHGRVETLRPAPVVDIGQNGNQEGKGSVWLLSFVEVYSVH